MVAINYWQHARARGRSTAADGLTPLAAALFGGTKPQEAMQLPEVTDVLGMPNGFLMGSTTHPADDRVWDVVIHPDQKETSIRQQGCDNTTGLVVTFPDAFVAQVAHKHGVKFARNAPPPELAHVQGTMFIVNVDKDTCIALTLQQLVIAVLDHVPPAPKDSDAASPG